MDRVPPRSTRTDTPFPCTTRFRSQGSRASRFARLVATSAGATATRGPLGLEPLGASAQLALFEEVLDTLERAAVPSGLVVIIDDLHWADRKSTRLNSSH